MIIANKEILDDFVQTHAQAAKPLNKWIDEVKGTKWHRHGDIKAMFPSVVISVSSALMLNTTR